MKEQVVIFVHVPKTAGTTLRHIIQYQLHPKYTFEFYRLARTKKYKGIDEFKNLSEARKKTIKLVSGHVGFGLHEFLPQPYSYITVLRDPIERVVSYYYYLLRNEKDSVMNKTLEDFVRTNKGAQNSMTKMISGVTLKNFLSKNQILEQNDNLDYKQGSSEILELAKINLKNYFGVVGIVERFDETLILLKRILGWKIPVSYAKSNVSKKRFSKSDISQGTLAVIEKYNELDIQLYKYAKEMFEEIINQQGASFATEIKELKTANESIKSKLHFKFSSSYNRLLYRLYDTSNRFLT